VSPSCDFFECWHRIEPGGSGRAWGRAAATHPAALPAPNGTGRSGGARRWALAPVLAHVHFAACRWRSPPCVRARDLLRHHHRLSPALFGAAPCHRLRKMVVFVTGSRTGPRPQSKVTTDTAVNPICFRFFCRGIGTYRRHRQWGVSVESRTDEKSPVHGPRAPLLPKEHHHPLDHGAIDGFPLT
jgi:hypothetical protein